MFPHASVRKPGILTIAFALTFALLGSGTMVAAQDSSIPVDAPVDIHSGTCEDLVAEPAFDGGQITETTTDDIWNDDQLQAGIFEDQALGASGVDFNGDGQLQEDEVITPDGVNAPAGKAENDLGDSVNTSEPFAVAVHQSPDAYDTIIACGSLQGAQESDGNSIVQLQPVGDSGIFGFSVLTDDTSSMTTYVFQPNTEPIQGSTPVSGQTEISGHPVDLHSGTCQDYTAEPAVDLGDFQETNVYAPEEQSPGDMEGEVPAEAQDLGPVYKIDTEDVDYGDVTDLMENGPFVVAVHQSAEEYGTIIACGQVLPVMDDDNTIVFLHPVGGGEQSGYVALNTDGLAQGFLWQMQDYQMQEQATPTPVSAGTPAPVTTPEPTTPTPVGTAVITETEVVPAPTATAEAEQTATPED